MILFFDLDLFFFFLKSYFKDSNRISIVLSVLLFYAQDKELYIYVLGDGTITVKPFSENTPLDLNKNCTPKNPCVYHATPVLMEK